MCSHSLCEFMPSAPLYLKNTVFLKSFTSSTSYIFQPYFPQKSPGLELGGVMKTSHSGLSTAVSLTLFIDQP